MVDVLTADEQERLEAAVKAAEARTRAEIVLMVRREATDYSAVETMAAAIASLALPALLLPFTSIPALIIWIAQLILFAVLVILMPMVSAGRYLVRQKRLARDVGAAARAEFFAHGLRRTSARAAVLVFVALKEHRVEILPDDAAAEAAGEGAWTPLADRLSARIARGEMVEGLEETASSIADLLAEKLPREPGSDDELPGVIVH